MSGFEIAGIVLAGPAIVEQLLRVTIDGYRVFQGVNLVGKDFQKCQLELNVTRIRLEDWMRDWSTCGKDLALILGAKTMRYQLVLETLVLIAEVFVQVEQLKKKYGIAPTGLDKSKGIQSAEVEALRQKKSVSFFKTLRTHLHPTRQAASSKSSRSNSSAPSKSTVSHRSLLKSELEKVSSDSTVISDEATIRGYSYRAELDIDVPELAERATETERKAKEYQKTITTFSKYEWVFSSQDELRHLILDLHKYISYLETLTCNLFQYKTTIESSILSNEFQVPTKIPFSQLSNFSGREDSIKEMRDLLNPTLSGEGRYNRRAMIVLQGMGGIGKSQVALEYVYRNMRDYSTVFWIDATNFSTINASGRQILATLISHYATKYHSTPNFARIATDLGIPGQIDSTGQLIDGPIAKLAWQVVRKWMTKDGNHGWCLIVDGISEGTDAINLQEVLPACAYGHVIVTSRMIVPGCDYLIDIPVMDKESGIKLLVGSKLAGLTQEGRQAAENIAEKLGNLPLALSQAAAYMMTRALDLIEYQRRLCIDISRFISSPFPPYADGVFSCWKMSVQALMESNPHAIDLLRLCSFLSPEGTSYDLLHRGLTSMRWLNNDEPLLHDTIDDLVRYALAKRMSFLSSSGETRSLWIHPLVQVWARESYCEEKNVILARDPKYLAQLRKEGAKNAVCLIGSGLKSEYYDRGSNEWIYERENMAQLRICYDEYIPKYLMDDDDIADERLAFALWKLGGLKKFWSEYLLAANLLRKSIALYEKLLPENPEIEVDMLKVRQQLCVIYTSRDRLDSSPDQVKIMIHETAMRQRMLLGELHPDALWSMQLQAVFLYDQGKYDESIDLYKKCMESNKKVLKPGDPINMATTHNLAMVYKDKGEIDKALELFQQCLALYAEYRGLNHQDTLVVLANVGEFVLLLGDLKGACECWKLVADGYEATFGLANSQTLKAILDLRELCLMMECFDEALRETEKFLEGWRIMNGEENPDRDNMLKEIANSREVVRSSAASLDLRSRTTLKLATEIEVREGSLRPGPLLGLQIGRGARYRVTGPCLHD